MFVFWWCLEVRSLVLEGAGNLRFTLENYQKYFFFAVFSPFGEEGQRPQLKLEPELKVKPKLKPDLEPEKKCQK